MYTAIIVEPRKHNALSFVLNNFLENLSDEWKIIIFHGNLNKQFTQNIINNSRYKLRIQMINLNVDNLTIREYNHLFMNDKSFYDKIPTETFLVFQIDTMIFPKYKHNINFFLKYDYVGAPWSFNLRNDENVGNGGLSLRKKSKMLEIMDKDLNKNYNEDEYFSCTNSVSLYKPSFEDAKKFSIEMVFSDESFGCHKPWNYNDNKKLIKIYPYIKELIQLNKK
jgi:hypothetical protein